MESECNCPICHKTFKDTAKLPCGHVFCCECVSMTERLAQKAGANPECPVCQGEFTAASEETPHQSSVYHDELVYRRDPKKKEVCEYCKNEPSLACEDNCGLLCEECQENHHSKMRKTAHHKVISLLEAGIKHRVNLSECILHKLPIISMCNQCWPVTEMCPMCENVDWKATKTHEYVDVKKIERGAIESKELLDKAEKKITEMGEKKEKVENEMKRIDQEEQEQLAKINNMYEDIVQKATELKEKLTDFVTAAFLPQHNLIEYMRHRIEASESILKHSIEMLAESQEIYERESIVTKLYKSAIFASKAVQIEIEDMPIVDLVELTQHIQIDGDVLVDGDGAHVLKEAYATCVSNVENLRKENDAWQAQVEEKEAAMKIADERIKQLEEEIAENQKEKDMISKMEREKEEERAMKESTGVDLYQKIWRCGIKEYVFRNKIGSQGNGNLQFNSPWGLAVHPKTKQIFVVEYSNHRVQVLNEDLTFARTFGSNGSNSGQFNTPTGIAISPDGRIAVAEIGGNIRVQIFDENCNFIDAIQSGRKKNLKCPQVNDFDGFSNPYFLCFDGEGNLYVANYSRSRVDKFNKSFEYEFSFAQSSLGEFGISSPYGICVTSKNEVCVFANGGDKINIYDTYGRFMRTLKIPKVSGNISIAEGPNNTILVSDYNNHQIRAYDSRSADLVHTFGSSQSSNDGSFNYPRGICFDANQKLYVCDYSNHRIQVFYKAE